jgi:hypothetical protein
LMKIRGNTSRVVVNTRTMVTTIDSPIGQEAYRNVELLANGTGVQTFKAVVKDPG